MNTFDAIEQRRAVKHYDPAHQLSDDEINQLMSRVVLSPTSFNIQNWRFVIVKDPDLRKRIRAVSWDQAQVTDAGLLVILCANKNAWKDSARYWQTAPEDVRNFLVSAIEQYYDGKDQIQHDEAMRSCGIAAQTLMLAAKAMGYDSCPMVGFDFEQVGKLINLPDDHVITMFVVIGKAVKPANPRGGQLPLSEVIVHDTF